LELHDAPADFHNGRGAMISIILPPAAAASPRGESRTENERETEKVGNGV